MIISLSWLQEYVTVDMPVERLAHLLTMAGLEVDAVHDRYAYLEKVVVGRITETAPHPNADKLKLCTVQAGPNSYRIVCGAPNAEKGMQAPLALPGSELPSGMTVNEGSIRGQHSQGMLCSEAELGLGADGTGLMTLSPELPPGQPLNQALKLSDAVLEIGLTPNRADCLSLLGIAREVAGFQGLRLKKAAIRLPKGQGDIREMTSVQVKSPDHCPRYAARLVENVTVGPSPFWLQDRLMSVGLRPINNIVDITNFVMMETGQPLHAFDFDHLAENRIVVRTATAGERFTTLDGKERELNANMLMICDGEKPVAVGGVMGGLNSEIEAGTTRVLIESAYFTPTSIRKTAKVLGLKTDASHRFERGVDPHGTLYALDRCAQLIARLGKGRMVAGHIDETCVLPEPRTIQLSVAATNRLLGTDIARAEMAGLLNAIEFKARNSKNNSLTVTVPSFRVDVHRPEDLMEEVARRAGYDKIPVTFPAMSAEGQSEPGLYGQRRRVRDLLSGMGFTEAINYSFIHADSCRRLRLPENDPRSRQLAVLNPLSEDQAVMRTSLVPGLLETMKRNLARQNRNLKLFETGNIFISNGENAQPDESEMLTALWTGDRTELGWHAKSEPCDFYDIKGAVEGLLDGLKVDNVRYTLLPGDQCHYTQPGATAQILVGNERLGIVGKVHPQVVNTFELRQDAFIFEMDMARLGAHIPDAARSLPLPRYPATTRDASLIVAQDLEADTLLSYVRDLGEALLEEVRLVAVFSGSPIADGFKSVSLRMVYRSPDTTLEDAAVNDLHQGITGRLVAHFKAQLPA